MLTKVFLELNVDYTLISLFKESSYIYFLMNYNLNGHMVPSTLFKHNKTCRLFNENNISLTTKSFSKYISD